MRRTHSRRIPIPYLFILPAAVMVVAFSLYPISRLFSLSVFQYNFLKPNSIQFVFLQNFVDMLKHDTLFWKTVQIALSWTSTTVVFQFVLGFVLALVLRSNFRGQGLYRTAVFSPWAVAGVLVSIMFTLLFNSNTGVVNVFLRYVGLIDHPLPWLETPKFARITTSIAAVWFGLPYFAISLMAAMQSIPDELYESAVIDGAGGVQKFLHITLPLLKNTIVLTTMLRFIWVFNYVDIIYAMTKGGPNYGSTTLSVYIVTTAIHRFEFGYSAALSVVLFLILTIFVFFYMKLGNFLGD